MIRLNFLKIKVPRNLFLTIDIRKIYEIILKNNYYLGA